MKKEESFYFPTINIIMLTFMLILSNVIVYYDFELFGYTILASTISFPFIYFFCNRITSKSTIKIALAAIATAVVAQSAVFLLTHYLTDVNLDLYNYFASLISFTITILLNLFLYNKFVIKGRKSFLRIALIYVAVLLIDSLIFLLIINKGIPSDFGMVFLISNVIRIIIGFLLAFLETCLK